MTFLSNGSGRFVVRPPILIAGMVAVLTAIYHLMLSGHWMGIPFLIWFALFCAFIFAVVGLSDKRGSTWTYLFLLPVVLSVGAKVFYESSVIQNLGTLIVFVSLAFFVYWYSSPKQSLRHLKTLWPMSFAQQTFWPFVNVSGFFSSFRVGRNGMLVATGLLLAVPFALVFIYLFSAADPLFGKSITDLFVNIDLETLTAKFIWDGFAAVVFLGIGWTAYTRSSEQREPKHTGHGSLHPGTMVLTGFLAPLTLIFLVFIGFQFAYFFGGEAFVQAQGLTYADYARNGFFQLLMVAGIVFGLCIVIYRTTDMKDAVPKWLTLALILETGVVIASAIRRLSLYIDAYGLTLSRWWAMAVVILIGIVLFGLFIAALVRVSYGLVAKTLCISALIVFSLLLFVNVDKIIVRHNASRFLSGQTSSFDLNYVTFSLTSDAYPALVEFVKQEWPNNNPPNREDSYGGQYVDGEKTYASGKDFLAGWLRDQGTLLREQDAKDWRNYVFSHTAALVSISTLY